jgi:hypothetical protein
MHEITAPQRLSSDSSIFEGVAGSAVEDARPVLRCGLVYTKATVKEIAAIALGRVKVAGGLRAVVEETVEEV